MTEETIQETTGDETIGIGTEIDENLLVTIDMTPRIPNASGVSLLGEMATRTGNQ